MQMKKQIGVIGGGAAGMMAAITAAKEGAQVTILERNDRVGKKILQTGNGNAIWEIVRFPWSVITVGIWNGSRMCWNILIRRIRYAFSKVSV